MVTVAVILAALTFAGRMSPILLLILTFALSAGDAFESPTWRSILPELVDKQDLTAASALNGIEFNFARAVGPGSITFGCREMVWYGGVVINEFRELTADGQRCQRISS